MADSTLLGATAALGSAAAWAIGAFLFKAIGEVLSPLAMTLAKGACSVVLLGVASVAFSQTSLDDRSLMLLVGSGLLGIAIGDTLFFQALKDLSAFSLIVLLMVGQALNVVLAMVFLGETLTIGQWIGIPLILTGVLLVMTKTSEGDSGESSATKMRGIAFGLLSAVCMAGSTVIAKKALNEESDTIQATFVRMLAGTLGVLVFGLATGSVRGWLTPFRDVRLLVKFVAAVSVIAFGGFWLGMVAFKHTSVAVASTLTSTEPVIALIITVLVLRQRAQLRDVVAACLTVVGVAMLVPAVSEFLRESLFF